MVTTPAPEAQQGTLGMEEANPQVSGDFDPSEHYLTIQERLDAAEAESVEICQKVWDRCQDISREAVNPDMFTADFHKFVKTYATIDNLYDLADQETLQEILNDCGTDIAPAMVKYMNILSSRGQQFTGMQVQVQSTDDGISSSFCPRWLRWRSLP